MEAELEKWIKYNQMLERLAKSVDTLTEYQKEDIEYTKKMIAKLERKINEKNKRR